MPDTTPDSAAPPAEGLPAISPDFVEQDFPVSLEEGIPTGGYDMLPLIGLGGSAGSLTALQEFFKAMPGDTGMAFVVVVHLSPEHSGILPELLATTTRMRVRAAEDGEPVEANCVYVIPPAKHLASVVGHLRLTDLERERGTRVAVDLFFRSLADTRGPHAAAIVLSGADGDGALGIKRIKERGGLTIAQDPDEAEHRGMPQSSIATGMVDWVLRVAQMPGRLLEYRTNKGRMRVLSEHGPQPAKAPQASADRDEEALREVLTFLHTRTERDFSYDKRATIVRRISRRMQINPVDDLPAYLTFLRTHQGESGALLQDLLKKHRIYRHRAALRTGSMPVAAGTMQRATEAQAHARRGPVLRKAGFEKNAVLLPTPETELRGENLSLRELHFRLHERLSAPSVIVNAEQEVVHLSENAGRLFTLAEGETTTNLLRIIHPRLRLELRGALFHAAESGRNIEVRGLPLELDGRQRSVTLRVSPARELAPGFQLVVFELGDALSDEPAPPASSSETAVQQLEHEVETTKGRLRDTVEQYEASGEELKASNEELHAMNEEMRAATEELETSREELQSINEELTTVNTELKAKIDEVGRANSDLHNLMASTAIATIFLDRDLRIMRYTPSAAAIFRVIPSDKGRQLDDLRHRLDYPELKADAERVLEHLCAVEREVRDADGRQFLARLLPYRTLENNISGVVLNVLDVTELKRAEEARAFLAAIVESSEDSVFSIDFARKITSWNAAAERLYGYPAREALGKPLTMLTLPEDLAQILTHVDRIRESKTVETFDTVRVHKDGHEMWLSVALSPVKDSHGEVIGVSIIARDITARHLAEEAVVLSEEQFRRAIEDAPIPVIMHAEDGQVLQVSNAWTKLTGYHARDIPNLDAWLSRAHGAGGDNVRARIEQLFAGEARQLDTELEVTTQAGDHRSWVFSASVPGTLRDGRRFIVGMALDLTERKQAEEALREGEERLRLIVENAREYAIFAMSLDRRITSWNAGANRILGYSQEEAIGQLGDIVFTDEDRAAGAPEDEATTAIAEGRATDERWHVCKDGRRFWGSGVVMSMHGAEGEAIGLVKIFRDHSEQLLAQKALEQALQGTEAARAEAEAAGKAKDHFLAVLSHELRTPLTPVLMSVDSLMLLRDLPAEVIEGLDMIQRNVTLEAQFIDELLDLTRISRGKFELSREVMDVHEAIRRAAEVASPDMAAKSQQLTCELDAGEHQLSGDFKRLQQVFWNLLKNAAKFSPERGVIIIRSRNEPSSPDRGAQIVVEISDTGIGFEQGDAERIFNAFTQASEAITHEFGDLGLGLAISKATVDAHSGTIRADSAGLNQGATFTVSLPLSGPPEGWRSD